MNRKEYLRELSSYLKQLPKKDYEDTMNYFEEYFDEVGIEGEEELIKELGSPRYAAREILSKLGNNEQSSVNYSQNYNSERKKWYDFKSKDTFEKFVFILLCIFAIPIGIPIAITFIALTFSFFVVIFSLIIIMGAFVFAGVLISGKLILVGGVSTFTSSFSGGLILLGAGLLVIGISILLVFLCIATFKFFVKMIKSLKDFIYEKRRIFNEK